MVGSPCSPRDSIVESLKTAVYICFVLYLISAGGQIQHWLFHHDQKWPALTFNDVRLCVAENLFMLAHKHLGGSVDDLSLHPCSMLNEYC